MTLFEWDGTANLWASDHWGRAGVAPVFPGDAGSSVDDEIDMGVGPNGPTNNSEVELTVARFDSSRAPNIGAVDPWFLTVTSVLKVGGGSATSGHEWTGNAVLATTIEFGKYGFNCGVVGDYAVFSGTYYTFNGYGGVVGDYATFNGQAYNSGMVGDHATFNASTGSDGEVGDYATFNDSAMNEGGTAGDHATFNGSAINATGIVGAQAVFNGNAYNIGTVGDHATFNDATFNEVGGEVGDYATFNGSDGNYGTVGDYVTFNGSAQNWEDATAGADAAKPCWMNSSATQRGTFTCTLRVSRDFKRFSAADPVLNGPVALVRREARMLIAGVVRAVCSEAYGVAGRPQWIGA